MKKLANILFIIGILMTLFYYNNKNILKKKAKDSINNYIMKTSIQNNDNKEEIKLEEITEEQKDIEKNSYINYTAIIEIPSIQLKQGVVDNTKNFNSIKYAISVDGNSNYPTENGNFILYAHSGTSSMSFFKNLNKVELDDNVYVYFNGIKYHYVIEDKYNIKKSGKATVLSSNTEKYITLITCNPIETKYQIVIVGKLIGQKEY